MIGLTLGSVEAGSDDVGEAAVVGGSHPGAFLGRRIVLNDFCPAGEKMKFVRLKVQRTINIRHSWNNTKDRRKFYNLID